MYIQYRSLYATITYAASTRCYYGEIELEAHLLSFQASSRHTIVEAMQWAVDQLAPSSVVLTT